ncbi:hypothetical protein UVI_02047900 [Ustilaginoidea virens]|uniref:Uncharacterized protein n=1 Tax=Ustilaginoidea virens TaxID=1159556 RepID=A0A1B5L1V8_USTVR|nr:hypothetical protein UVI_02047900 [Ustilaginoidea virens]
MGDQYGVCFWDLVRINTAPKSAGLTLPGVIQSRLSKKSSQGQEKKARGSVQCGRTEGRPAWFVVTNFHHVSAEHLLDQWEWVAKYQTDTANQVDQAAGLDLKKNMNAWVPKCRGLE